LQRTCRLPAFGDIERRVASKHMGREPDRSNQGSIERLARSASEVHLRHRACTPARLSVRPSPFYVNPLLCCVVSCSQSFLLIFLRPFLFSWSCFLSQNALSSNPLSHGCLVCAARLCKEKRDRRRGNAYQRPLVVFLCLVILRYSHLDLPFFPSFLSSF